jgi:hypothetical protein
VGGHYDQCPAWIEYHGGTICAAVDLRGGQA